MHLRSTFVDIFHITIVILDFDEPIYLAAKTDAVMNELSMEEPCDVCGERKDTMGHGLRQRLPSTVCRFINKRMTAGENVNIEALEFAWFTCWEPFKKLSPPSSSETKSKYWKSQRGFGSGFGNLMALDSQMWFKSRYHGLEHLTWANIEEVAATAQDDRTLGVLLERSLESIRSERDAGESLSTFRDMPFPDSVDDDSRAEFASPDQRR